MTSHTAAKPEAARYTCQLCGAPMRHLRRSERWDFDVARCRNCRTVAVVGADQVAPGKLPDEADDINWDGYAEILRDDSDLRLTVLEELRRRIRTGSEVPTLFDVGAGDGTFLDVARQHGFAVAGNELSQTALTQAANKYGIELSPLMIEDQPDAAFDAITMWCVIAHVPDSEAMLRDAYAKLRPGGVIFIRTPRWCAVDSTGFALDRISRGRMPELADRRVFPGHWRMFNARSLNDVMRNVGFVDIQAEPSCHYSLKSEVLVSGTGGPMKLFRRGTRLMDWMIQKQWVPRNVLLAYGQRPE
jgi:SAM-dependent methyltransferase